MKKLICFSALFLFIFINYSGNLPCASKTNEMYVSPAGSDKNPGTLTKPFKTISKAASWAVPGTIVYVKTGTYNESIEIKVSGEPGKYITFTNFDNDEVIIEGKNLKTEDGFKLNNKNYIKIIGFKICNFSTSNEQLVPKGIFISGAGSNIELKNNKIFNIRSAGTEHSNAHGIAIYGNTTEPITNLIIDGNEIFNCTLGRSESLAINGNVENFKVINNTVHDNDNIGIDFIGHEGVCPDPLKDQARNGICANNIVYNIDSYSNPAYNKERAAAGIYVDGGKNITIESNTIYGCNYGIEIGCENKGKLTSNITVTQNIVHNCHVSGISFGGYAKDTGRVKDCTFLNNTLYGSGTLNNPDNQYGEVNIQWAQDCTFKNNVFFAKAYGGTNPFGVTNWDTDSFSGIVFENNIWYTSTANPEDLSFIINSNEIRGFEQWLLTGQDKHSVFRKPDIKILTEK
ncbi:MAG: hypothetical protein A2252_02865 [Elusimicrobia bacterium RIFOXYA2_FULL_39_19]|nr:MAG: hypothetical protein A2252_02865 [Elusimicrobia bacterium RIFOXYA2_FULL_39_19]